MDINSFIEGLGAALTPVIAVVTTYIMYQQWRTNLMSIKALQLPSAFVCRSSRRAFRYRGARRV